MKWHILASVLIVLLGALASCGSQKRTDAESQTNETAAPREAALNDAAAIDQLLLEYEAAVSLYTDTADSLHAADADAALAELGAKLSQAAFYFSDEQLAVYNAITAELGE